MILSLVLMVSNAQADCALPTTARDIAQSVEDVQSAFIAMDINAFNEAESQTISSIECLEDSLTPYDIAGIHRSSALRSFIVRDLESAIASYAAALSAQPNYNLPVSIAPEGGSLYKLYRDARPLSEGQPDRIAQEVPRGAALLVDGRRSQMRPLDRPAVIQLVDLKGNVLWSDYIPTGGVEPAFSGVKVPQPEDSVSQSNSTTNTRTATPPESRSSFQIDATRRPSKPKMTDSTKTLFTTSGGAMAAAAVLYSTAMISGAKYNNTDTQYSDLTTLRSLTNGLVIASSAAGTLGLGLGAYAYFSW